MACRTGWLLVGPVGALLLACGGSSGTGVGGGDAAADTMSSNDGAGNDSSTGDTGSAETGDRDSGTGGDGGVGADGGACPDVHGSYTLVATGQGCGDLAASAPQCIQQGTGCHVHFVSNPPTGGSAINGGADLMSDGSFSGAALTEGTGQRTGCTGTWDSAMSVMTVDCGGVGSSQSCVVTLTRTGSTCM